MGSIQETPTRSVPPPGEPQPSRSTDRRQGQDLPDKLALARQMPWAIGYEVCRVAALPFIRLMFAIHGIPWGRRWRVWGMPMIQRYGGSRIQLGDGLQLRSWRSTNPLTPSHPVVLATRSPGAEIVVGEDVGMTGATLVAVERIQIGARVVIGANAVILDTDFHPLDPLRRQADPMAGDHNPVVIGEDVFIGMQALILKGVQVGAGAVIGAGSVVTRDVPARAVVAGNPARLIRFLIGEGG